MTLNLPLAVAAYFAADNRDGEAVAECFTENATVTDEGRTHTGRNDIKKWKKEASAKYVYTCVPLSAEVRDGINIVTGRVTGNFPGSPVDLRFFFHVEGNLIASLEITP